MMVAFSCFLVLLVKGEDPLLLLAERQSGPLVQEAVLLAERAAGERERGPNPLITRLSFFHPQNK